MSDKQVIILSGISGSGKSTLAIELSVELGLSNTLVVSADNFFRTSKGYKFDPSRLSEAHQDCFRRYLTALGWTGGRSIPTDRYATVIVDNTNLNAYEISPYALAAEASGYKVSIIRVHCDPDEAFERNIHGVPLEVANRQFTAFAKRDVLPWWNVQEMSSIEEIRYAL